MFVVTFLEENGSKVLQTKSNQFSSQSPVFPPELHTHGGLLFQVAFKVAFKGLGMRDGLRVHSSVNPLKATWNIEDTKKRQILISLEKFT